MTNVEDDILKGLQELKSSLSNAFSNLLEVFSIEEPYEFTDEEIKLFEKGTKEMANDMNELCVLGLFLDEYAKAKEELAEDKETGVDSMMSDILVTDNVSIHVFDGDKLVDIYTKETGVPKIHVEEDYKFSDEELADPQLLMNGADIDGDILDKDWARDRNREIEKEVKKLREILDYNSTELKPERVEEIKEEIENLLEERDDNTFKYGLAGKRFDDLYLERRGWRFSGVPDFVDEFPKDYSHKPNDNEARFKKITKEMVDLYSRKNTDYGGSFDESLDEDGLLVAKIRLKDKLNRFSQLIDNDSLVEDESIRDTLIDLGNYSIMTLMWLNEQENS